MKNQKVYFCGVGGNGMSPLARLMSARGYQIYGSDRSYDQGRNSSFFQLLQREGIKLVPQDGSALDSSITKVVVTRAVEDSIPDIKKAKDLQIPIQKRPLLMQELFKDSFNIAVAGTGGKSTTTAMIGHILTELNYQPTVVNGAVMLNNDSNIYLGKTELAVFEADESDGMNDVVALCPVSIAVLTNISLDHFEINELKEIFGYYINHAKEGVVLNADCKNSTTLKDLARRSITFGVDNEADITPEKVKVELNLYGKHNIENALAAIAACTLYGIEPQVASNALKTFKGVKRRLELLSSKSDVLVFDDFSSNPAKIQAALTTVKNLGKRVIAVFQPHGFQPTKMMKEGYIEVFSKYLELEDFILMPEIYYAGGNANLRDGKAIPLQMDISSQDLIREIKGVNARFFKNREEIASFISSIVRPKDVVIVLGSRDETLSDFALDIANKIR